MTKKIKREMPTKISGLWRQGSPGVSLAPSSLPQGSPQRLWGLGAEPRLPHTPPAAPTVNVVIHGLLCLRALPLSAQCGACSSLPTGCLALWSACLLSFTWSGARRNACYLGTRPVPQGRNGIVRGVCMACGQQTVELLKFFHVSWEIAVALSPPGTPLPSWPPPSLPWVPPHLL